jgi:Na+/H+-translocating membrane pyrophosphatase
MARLHPSARKATDLIDAAGKSTAAIGKGFAIGSACLVALALFDAFVTRTGTTAATILQPLEVAGLLVGAIASLCILCSYYGRCWLSCLRNDY